MSFSADAPKAKLDNFVDYEDDDLETEEGEFVDLASAFIPSGMGVRPMSELPREALQYAPRLRHPTESSNSRSPEKPVEYLEDIIQASNKLKTKISTIPASAPSTSQFVELDPQIETTPDQHNAPCSPRVEADETASIEEKKSPRERSPIGRRDDEILTDADHYFAERLSSEAHEEASPYIHGPQPAIVREVLNRPIIHEGSGDIITHEPIEPFSIDPDFDYDNVVLTPKWDPFFHPELFPELSRRSR
eukprot:TRINITY_DN5123_c0_g1_i4.p1 TRINITY_DN5123_c0_g1~~TRINITY_DN5123_c0_g1_i4.p1  ORF type:complete len:248 (+),score=46.67 TRINITY_DN5123_c0_g1_i4:147-890(+)